MKYGVKLGLGAMIYIPSFKKTGSDIRKLTGRNSQIHRRQSDLISLLFK
jgi:hypothetical protein